MAQFTSTYGSLIVCVDGEAPVKFRDGKAEASGKAADAVRRLADEYGITEAKSGDDGPTQADLKAEVAKRNEGRSDEDKIKPKSQKKADLQAALDADDEAQGEDDPED